MSISLFKTIHETQSQEICADLNCDIIRKISTRIDILYAIQIMLQNNTYNHIDNGIYRAFMNEIGKKIESQMTFKHAFEYLLNNTKVV